MALNLGYIEATAADNDVVVRVYYDNALPASDSQPLINGPRGFCLDVTNVSGRKATVVLTQQGGAELNLTVAKGNPVTTGQSRSRTAAQMASLGMTTRGDIAGFQIADQ